MTAKVYRIEGGRREDHPDLTATQRHNEIMQILRDIRQHQAANNLPETVLEDHIRQFQEVMSLKTELDAISQSIQQTKSEIATLHYAGAQGREIARVTDELGEVVMGTEAATNTILTAAERVDEIAGNLTARLSGDDQELAKEISDKVITIFEACNFQDITGQRIGKVVNTMRFIEERVERMIEIWGGIESFKEVEVLADPNRQGDNALLNGPALGNEDSTSQDAIDALFG